MDRIEETLRRLLEAVISEAARNPAFAARLAEAIGREPDVRPRSSRRAPGGAFDPTQCHAINILRLHGEAALRGRLEQIRAVEDLRSVARASGLVLAGKAARARPSRQDLIVGIVEAAKHYDAQRSAATA